MKELINIVWFKKDLRIIDHLPLSQATMAGGKVLCLYIDEIAMWEQDCQSDRHRAFALQSVADLANQLLSAGASLTYMKGDVVEIINWLQERYVNIHIWSHEETGNLWSFERDKNLARWCRLTGIQWTELSSNGVVRKLATRDGWAGIWNDKMSQPLAGPVDFSKIIKLEAGTEIPQLKSLFVQEGGRTQALKALNAFLSCRGKNYRGGISSPNTAVTACSRLSPYLAWGCLSMKEIVHRLEQRQAELKLLTPKERGGWLSSLRDFKSRLYWHCHFIQKLEIMPDLENRNIHTAYDGLREDSFDEKLYQAWCVGQTGFPFIDACMRYLNKHGWINFRMRAMLVSFATQNLWLHWKPVALHLGRQFTDYEPGIHYSQIQMQAGTTGINAPRIYNPVKQSADQDPNGQFIRQNVPELKDCEDSFIHNPSEKDNLFSANLNYPRPIVDHLKSYSEARKKLSAVRKKAGFKEEAGEIRELIASRKK
ncbi:MAG: deoxyribodipyrimidine photo-lyase [Lentisphaerales bacterium]|nr:deoxyribodipyrimidine photo-lyase [Lentisphaerales bacterium]